MAAACRSGDLGGADRTHLYRVGEVCSLNQENLSLQECDSSQDSFAIVEDCLPFHEPLSYSPPPDSLRSVYVSLERKWQRTS